MKDTGAYRVRHGSPCERTLGWEALPELGEDRERRAYRAKVWRTIFFSLALFWGGVIWLIAGAA